MSDALPLAPRPSLEQYRKLAKDLQRACRSADPDAVREWAVRWLGVLRERLRASNRAPFPEDAQREASRLQHRWREFRRKYPTEEPCRLTGVQFFVAREHGFESWPRFVEHIEHVNRTASTISQFEAAANAIVSGDIETLRALLRSNPGLVHARSTRDHRSTLLHYVSANGIEDFRQKTPPNILEITQLLFEAGADANATSDAYGGGSTTLGLTATSWHPEHAGVQVPLIELLIRHGAAIEGPDAGSGRIVNACLHNGRGAAAAHLARLGARLDLEGAAGVGRLDEVSAFFDDRNAPGQRPAAEQLRAAFAMACQFGHSSVVEFLVEKGMPPDGPLDSRATGLHWAAYGGHADTVRLLLERGAPADTVESTYGGTPLGWALYGWCSVATPEARARSYYDVVAQLVRAGARLDRDWYAQDDDRRRALARADGDPRMSAALRGESSGGTATR